MDFISENIFSLSVLAFVVFIYIFLRRYVNKGPQEIAQDIVDSEISDEELDDLLQSFDVELRSKVLEELREKQKK